MVPLHVKLQYIVSSVLPHGLFRQTSTGHLLKYCSSSNAAGIDACLRALGMCDTHGCLTNKKEFNNSSSILCIQ